jgi:hypothetical protein
MKAFSTILITLLSLPFYAVSPKSTGAPKAQAIVIGFQGVSMSYDAAGNRIFRSMMPQLELPGTASPQPIDTMVTHAPDPSGDETGPVEEP